MAKKFKKNQPVIATLPTGRVVEGFYVEPWSDDGHTIRVDEYEGERGGKPVYKSVNYGVKDEFIDPVDDSDKKEEAAYKNWLKRAMTLEERIKEYNKEKDSLIGVVGTENNIVIDKINKKIERTQSKLDQINAKIEEFEAKE
jgi:hypothetical protein